MRQRCNAAGSTAARKRRAAINAGMTRAPRLVGETAAAKRSDSHDELMAKVASGAITLARTRRPAARRSGRGEQR